MSTLNNETYYFPWVRKGLSVVANKGEEDILGLMPQDSDALKKQRPALNITATYKVTSPENKESDLSESKEIQFVSPGDVLRVSANAVLKTIPANGSRGFPRQYYPYIEFWEPDFPWRYTPAAIKNNKLRPWFALLVCEASMCTLRRLDDGRPYVSFNVKDDNDYQKIFLSPTDTWKTAHAQGMNQSDPEFSRLIALRRPSPQPEGKYDLKGDTEYVAFLVPSFETGRLRGLGSGEEELNEIIAQTPAWEDSLELQKSRRPKQPLDFPVYYSWAFTTGSDNFDVLAEKLKKEDSAAEIKIDVSRMGNGFDYNALDSDDIPTRNVIGMPTATKTINYQTGAPFPSNSGKEKELYKRLKDLLDNNPVFAENLTEITNKPEADEVGDDDPWVVPPVYGAKHVMATRMNREGKPDDPPEWLAQLNLDAHYRAVAGLGKRTVQIHQEEFVNRAWKQVEAVNALNYELYQRLLSVNTNDFLKDKVLGSMDDDDIQFNEQYLARMMRYLGSLKNAKFENISLNNMLKNSNIPTSFATASFQHLADDVAKRAASLDTTTLMENIAKSHTFSNMPELEHSLTNIDQLYKYKDEHPYNFAFTVLCNEKMTGLDVNLGTISSYFNIVRNPQAKDFSELFKLELKPISHTIENNKDYLFAPNYKLKRYNDYFKSLLSGWNLKRSFQLTNFLLLKKVSVLGKNIYNKNFLNQTELGNSIYTSIYTKMREFLDSGKTNHLCYGYTSDRVTYSPLQTFSSSSKATDYKKNTCTVEYARSYRTKTYGAANVIVLSDQEFCNLFNISGAV